MIQLETHSPQETQEAAARLAALLRPGDVLAYTGPMGAGKTTFTAGLARGLGLTDWVSSPTFALVHQYTQGTGPSLCHFDLFRIHNEDELYDTGFFDYLDGQNILAVEWSENIPGSLPPDAIRVDLTPTGEQSRLITMTGDERF